MAGPATQADSEVMARLLSALHTSSFPLRFNLGAVTSAFLLLLEVRVFMKKSPMTVQVQAGRGLSGYSACLPPEVIPRTHVFKKLDVAGAHL